MPAHSVRSVRSIRSQRLALFATSLGFFIICLDVTVVNVALARIRSALGAAPTELEWVMNAYTLAFASLLLGAGALSDRLGARRVFVGGFALFSGASVACGLAGSVVPLIAARALQGVAAALCVPSSLALLNAAFPEPRARAKAVGIWAGTASLALGAGPIVGGVLVERFGWASIFLVNVPLGLVGIWLTLAHAPDTRLDGARRTTRRFDPLGQLLAIASLAALTFAVVEGGRWGWTSAAINVAFATAALGALLFVASQAWRRNPMLPLTLFTLPAVNVSSLVGLALNFGYYGLMFAMSLYFQNVRGDTPFQTGLAFLPMTAVVAIANLASSALSVRFGYRVPMIAGQLLAAAGYLSLVSIDASSGGLATAVPLLAVGTGVALAVPSINTVVLATVDAASVGIASGVLNTARQIGGVIGVGVFGALAGSAAGARLIDGLHVAAMWAAVLMLAGAVLAGVGLRARRVPAPMDGV